jgi:FecR protein
MKLFPIRSIFNHCTDQATSLGLGLGLAAVVGVGCVASTASQVLNYRLCYGALAALLLGSVATAPVQAQTKPPLLKEKNAETAVYIHRTTERDTPNSIAEDFLAKARWESIRAQFFKDNKLSGLNANAPLPANLPISIPVASMFVKRAQAKLIGFSGLVTAGYANENTLSVAKALNAKERGKLLEEGAVIKTADNSFAKLLLPDNSVMAIQPNSEVRLETMRQYANSDIFNIQTVLSSGRVNSKVAPIKHPAGDYVVHTKRLTTGVRGTDFSVADNTNQNAVTEVGEGAVLMLDADKEGKKIPGGYGRFVDKTQASDLIPLLPAPLWFCDGTARLTNVVLPVVMAAKPKHYRLDIYDQTHGLNDDSVPYQQVILDRPLLPNDLPLGVYRVNIRGIDKHGLQGYSKDNLLTVSEPREEEVLRWVRNSEHAKWTLNSSNPSNPSNPSNQSNQSNQSNGSPLNQYVCAPQ